MTDTILSAIHEALSRVNDPELRRPLTDLGMVGSVEYVEGVVRLGIKLTISGCPMRDRLQSDITEALLAVPGIERVEITFGVMSDEEREAVKKLLRGGREKFNPFAQEDCLTRVIGIASGKGGVGKSSVTANLAVAAAARGLSVGILDADVYGHSIPRLMGVLDKRPTALDQTFIPVENHGVKIVSMEMFKPNREDPIAYRGPLLHRVLEQLMSDAYWGSLDLLLLDLPPGTGDIAISLGQLIPRSEILVVTTPQIAAAEVAERAGRIAFQMKQRIIGVVENMSASPCPHCGEPIALFGSGGGAETARRLGALVGSEVPLLAQVPFDGGLRDGGDNGTPAYLNASGSGENLIKKTFDELLTKLMATRPSLVGVPLSLHT
jgi:ATP-binding protein involved in chromosome partitioning